MAYLRIPIPFDDCKGSTTIYKRTGTLWSKKATLIANDGAADDWFGAAVATSSDETIVVGAPSKDEKRGSAYVFSYSADYWIEVAKLIGSNAISNDEFGANVDIYGDAVVVNGSRGWTYVYKRTTWVEQAKLVNSIDVEISGETIVTGNYEGAYVFMKEGTNWSEHAVFSVSNAVGGGFGSSVAISEQTVVVGAWLDDSLARDSGSVYVVDL